MSDPSGFTIVTVNAPTVTETLAILVTSEMDAQQARAEGILADFAAEVNAATAEPPDLHELYAALGLAAAACIAGGWTQAQTDELEAAYAALQREALGLP